MQTFKDSKDREWIVNLSLLKLKELDGIDWSDLTGDPSIHVMRPHDEVFLEALAHTPTMLELVWHIVKDTVNPLLSTDPNYDPYLDFAEAVGSGVEVIGRAREALYKELDDFFPGLRITRERYWKYLENISEETMKKLNQLITENSQEDNGTTSSESVESLESTGDLEPSVS